MNRALRVIILISVFGIHWSGKLMSADEEVRIPKAEFEKLWQTSVQVVGTIESFTPGNGDALVYEYEGHANLCSDSISVVRVVVLRSGPQEQPKTLRISVPRDDAGPANLLRNAGSKVRFCVPLLYIKYDPWGFVPFADLKMIEKESDEQAKPSAQN